MSYDTDRERLPDLVPTASLLRRRLDPELVDRHGRRGIPGIEYAAHLARKDASLQIGSADCTAMRRQTRDEALSVLERAAAAQDADNAARQERIFSAMHAR